MLRISILAALSIITLSGVLLADSAFYGAITYTNCTCADGAYADIITITDKFNNSYSTGTLCYPGGDGYNFGNIPAGTYTMTVTFNGTSGCNFFVTQTVVHDGVNPTVKNIKLVNQ